MSILLPLLRVEKGDGEYVLYDQQTTKQEVEGELIPVFYDGECLSHQQYSEIRQRLWN
jgi:hypothetical protein